jgi:flagellar protein FliS
VNDRRKAQLASRYQSDGMATASPRKLLVLLFDRLVKDFDQARDAITANRVEAAHDALVHAQEIVHELRLALDPEVWDGAEQLISIYDYVYDLLIQANQDKALVPLEEGYQLILPLHEAWTTAYQQVQMGQSATLGASV